MRALREPIKKEHITIKNWRTVRMDQKIGNIIEQMQVTMDGMIERLAKLEMELSSLQQSGISLKKPKLYIDENTALLSSNEADIRWIAEKVEAHEMSEMR